MPNLFRHLTEIAKNILKFKSFPKGKNQTDLLAIFKVKVVRPEQIRLSNKIDAETSSA